jgi:hypothetical protein
MIATFVSFIYLFFTHFITGIVHNHTCHHQRTPNVRMILDQPNLPENWLKSPRVLVGINQMEHLDSIPDNPNDPP